MPTRARWILGGLALALVVGLGLLAWVALRGGAPERATGSGARGESALAPDGSARELELASEDAYGATGADEAAARVELVAEALEDGVDWGGRVVDGDSGEPIEGAQVALSAGERTREALTDAEGRFALDWPAGLDARLAIRHPRYVDAAAARVDLALEGSFALQRSGVLRGRVQPPGGEGTVSAWLQTSSSQRSWIGVEAPLAADGRFAFLDLTPGEYLLAARVSERAVAPEAGLVLEAGDELEVVLQARDGARVQGRAISEPGRAPLAGLTVLLEPRNGDLPREWLRNVVQETTSDADGRFAFAGLAPGEWQVVARDARGRRTGRDLEVTGSGERHEVELAVALGVSLAGRVVDGSGAVVAGSEVAVFGRGGGPRDFLGGQGEAQAVCDEQGWFRIDGIEPNASLNVAARSPSQDGERPERFGTTGVARLEPGASRQDVLVELRTTGSLAGRVLSSTGEPITAQVFVHARIDARTVVTAELVADADGRFLAQRLPGEGGVVEARAEGWRNARTDALFDGSEVELRMEPALGLEGWAVDAQGLAVAGVPISVQPAVTGDDDGQSRRMRRNTTTDADGRFAFADLQPGAWELRASSFAWRLDGPEPLVFAIPAEAALRLVFERSERPAAGAIEGEIALPGGAAPTGIELEGLRGGVMAVERGRFRVSGVRPATHDLTLRADGHARVPLEPFDLAPGGVHDVGRVLLEPSTHLTVRVRQRGGGDIDGARVRLVPLAEGEGGAGEDARTLRLETTRSGRYETTDATRHAWRLVVERPGFRRHAARLEVLPEARQSVEVELEPDS